MSKRKERNVSVRVLRKESSELTKEKLLCSFVPYFGCFEGAEAVDERFFRVDFPCSSVTSNGYKSDNGDEIICRDALPIWAILIAPLCLLNNTHNFATASRSIWCAKTNLTTNENPYKLELLASFAHANQNTDAFLLSWVSICGSFAMLPKIVEDISVL